MPSADAASHTHIYIDRSVISIGILHKPSGLALLPIFLETSRATSLAIANSRTSILVHLSIPLFLLSCDERLKSVLLTSGKVNRS